MPSAVFAETEIKHSPGVENFKINLPPAPPVLVQPPPFAFTIKFVGDTPAAETAIGLSTPM